ncbi:MAG: CRISPR-associated endonuclease Cas1 [Alphaproteobacteria bacterium]|nr:CRISPR-associated endonuclease Cas1 [Alphaproteobacteria bacterium]
MLRSSTIEAAIAGRNNSPQSRSYSGRSKLTKSNGQSSDHSVQSDDQSAVHSDHDDRSWADRSDFWLQKITPKSRQFVKRAGIAEPLILTGHGVSLRIDHGSLLVRNGFTHYPQDREEWRFFSGDWRLPSRIVLLDVDGGISFDALAWLGTRQIPMVQINWRGEVTNIVCMIGTAVSTKLAERQRAARAGRQCVRIAHDLITQKVANSIATLRSAFPNSPVAKSALKKLNAELADLGRRVPPSVGQLRGIEGRVGYAYFNAWRSHSLNWSNTKRHPFPDDWYRIGPRSSKAGKISNPNRFATHPFNAMLNYAYGVLETQVRRQIVASGLDPAFGYLHGSYSGKQALVYDLMEPLRPVIDRQVLEFVQHQRFEPADFVLLDDGVCRLNPQLARNIVRAIDVSGDAQKCLGRFVRSLN